MQPQAVVKDFHELEYRVTGLGTGWPCVHMNELGFEGGEEALGDGVVPALTRRDRDWRMPLASSRSPNTVEVYCEPRSECNISPGAGRRWWMAMRRASQTSSVRMWSAMAQPTTRREATSITVAR